MINLLSEFMGNWDLNLHKSPVIHSDVHAMVEGEALLYLQNLILRQS